MADDRGRGDDNHSDKDDVSGEDQGDAGQQGDANQGDAGQQGNTGDQVGPPDAGRAPGESPFGLPLNRPGGGSPGSGAGPAGFGSGFGGGFGEGFPGLPDLGGMDPSDLGAMLEKVLGEAADNPELAEVMKSMGVDPTDPATQAAMRAQLGTFMAAQESPTGSRDMATEVARRHVMAAQGNDVHDEAAAPAVADAVAVATLWLDEQTTLASPAWRATGLSRAEMVEQWAPMLGNLSRQMFSAQLGQAVGTLATEVVSGTEVGLPLTEPGVVA